MEGFDFSLAPWGALNVNGTSETTALSKAIYVAEDSVISSIKYVGSSDNVVTDMISDPANPVKQFVILTPKDGNIIEKITFTSGSGSMIRSKP